MQRAILWFWSLAWLATGSLPCRAQLPLPHYQPGTYSVDSMMEQPSAPGLYFSGQFTNYSSARLNDGQGQPVTRDLRKGDRIKGDIEAFSINPALTYMTDKTVLGAQYGVCLSVPLTNQSLSAAVQFQGRGFTGGSKTLSLGDVSLYPLILNWERGNGCTWFGWCLNLPTGYFRSNDPTSTGLGFFSQTFQLGEGLYLDSGHTVQLASLISYEVAGRQTGSGELMGDHVTADFGLSKSFSPSFSAGLTGYGQWQLTPTTGAPVPELTRTWRDHVLGLGLELQWTTTDNLTIVLRGIRELNSVHRAQGTNVNLNFSLPIFVDTDP